MSVSKGSDCRKLHAIRNCYFEIPKCPPAEQFCCVLGGNDTKILQNSAFIVMGYCCIRDTNGNKYSLRGPL